MDEFFGIFGLAGDPRLQIQQGLYSAELQRRAAEEARIRTQAAYDEQMAIFRARTEGQKWGEAEDAEFVEVVDEPKSLTHQVPVR